MPDSESQFDDLPDVLTAQEVAQILRVSPKTIYEVFKRGEMPGQRVGKIIRFSRKRILEWLESGEEMRPKGRRKYR